MALEEKFDDVLKEWKAHCKKNSIHSFPEPYMSCSDYEELASMGKKNSSIYKR